MMCCLFYSNSHGPEDISWVDFKMAEILNARLVCLHLGNNNLLEDIKLLPEEVYVAGRKPGSSIFLDLDDVSNKHAEFGYGGNAWTIIDCGSTNGVYINGNKISIQKLRNGDEIQIGSALFCYQEDRGAIHSFFSSEKIKYAAFGLLGAVTVIAGMSLFNLFIKDRPVSDNIHDKLDPEIVTKAPEITGKKLVLGKASKPGNDHNAGKEIIVKTQSITGEALVNKKSSKLRIYYNAKNENVLILDFPSLRQHGLMFNRMLAFVEGPGISKHSLLREPELLSFLKKKKLTYDTFAFGNDFMLKDIVDFFNLANHTFVELNEEESRLKIILIEHEFMVMGDNGLFKTTPVNKAVISITQLQPDDPSTAVDELIDMDIRRALLMHELSHGEFFTNQAYRNYCMDFWHYKMSETEREAFKKMLSDNSYDIRNEELCINEMQAYLMNTPDKRLFSATLLGMTDDELYHLQHKFIIGNPPTYLYANYSHEDAKNELNF